MKTDPDYQLLTSAQIDGTAFGEDPSTLAVS